MVGSSRHCPPVLQEGRKTANIHANSGFIWGIPVKSSIATDLLPAIDAVLAGKKYVSPKAL
jgi:hypothetical protein